VAVVISWPLAVVPAAPLVGVATGDATFTVSWFPPADGGSPLTQYHLVITYFDPLTYSNLTLVDELLAATITTRTFTAVTNYRTYNIQVTAFNVLGPGSTATAAAMPVHPPVPPEPGVPRSIQEMALVNLYNDQVLNFAGSNGYGFWNGTLVTNPLTFAPLETTTGRLVWDAPASIDRANSVTVWVIPRDVQINIKTVETRATNQPLWRRLKKQLGDGRQFDQSDQALPFYDQDAGRSTFPYAVRLWVSDPVLIELSGESVDPVTGDVVVHQLCVIRCDRRGENISPKFQLPRGVTVIRAQIPVAAGDITLDANGNVS
jgi:hypothetical protein